MNMKYSTIIHNVFEYAYVIWICNGLVHWITKWESLFYVGLLSTIVVFASWVAIVCDDYHTTRSIRETIKKNRGGLSFICFYIVLSAFLLCIQ